DDDSVLRDQVDQYRAFTRELSGRDIQVWSSAYVAQADSYEDAVKHVNYYAVEHGDDAHADAFIAESITRSRLVEPAALAKLRYAIKAGSGGAAFLGTAHDIAAKLEGVSRCGLDGLLLVWMDVQNGIRRFNRDVLPLLEQAGLRQPRSQKGPLAA